MCPELLANHIFSFNFIFLSDGETAVAEWDACFADIYTAASRRYKYQYAANLPQYAANLPSGRMSPPTELDLPSLLLPALAPQPRGGASREAPGRSATAQPSPHLPASPHRVEGSRLAGEPRTASTLPANVACNMHSPYRWCQQFV